ncbi:MAG TPA: T9SS type A sorting domain-containing protein, partial [Ferruginibacter sp.]|nr:T9SS type A sorting domain-containing protein [Ferruginibacter sp.]
TSVDVRYDLHGVIPKAAILNDGGNAPIHISYMTAAAIPSMNYVTLYSATGLTAGCYTFASEPHNGLQGAEIDSIKSFVSLGGNFLAQCHAITSYENWTGGHFETSSGVNGNNGNIGTNIDYVNNDVPFAQFEGGYDANQGGSVQTWTLAAGSVPQNNFYGLIKGNTAALANTYGASGAKLKTGRGGNVWYIGNHQFSGTASVDLNGIRMYMNALITPSYASACDAARLLPVKLGYFAAKKVNEQQVQLDWATTAEINTKEFVILRSNDGINYTELTKVNAKGNSSTEVKYGIMDPAPKAGANFYRLVTVDIDGWKSYSDIVLVNMNIATVKAMMSVYPNPAHDEVTINLSNLPLYNNSLIVSDMTGAVLINKLALNGSAIKLNVSTLKSGTYVVKVVTTDGNVTQEKIMVTNNR